MPAIAIVRKLIIESSSCVFLIRDFYSLGSVSQVQRIFAQLVACGQLIRVSKGAYAKTRINSFTGKPSPAGSLEDISAELLAQLQIKVKPSQAVVDYNSGKSTQLPGFAEVSTGTRRITRKITVGARTLTYSKR